MSLSLSLHMRHMPKAKTAFHPPKAMHYWWSDQWDALKHTLCFPVWWLAACVNRCVCVCVSVFILFCMWPNRWAGFFSVTSCVSEQGANRRADNDSRAVIGSCTLLSSWQQPLWPTAISPVSTEVYYLFLVAHSNTSYAWCHNFKRLLTQHLCLRRALQHTSTHNKLHFFTSCLMFIFSIHPFQYKQKARRTSLAK